MQEKSQKDYSYLIEQIKRTRAIGITLVRLGIVRGKTTINIPAVAVTRGRETVSNSAFGLKDSKDYVERIDDIGLFKREIATNE